MRVLRRGLLAAACAGMVAGCGAVDPPAHLGATRAVVDAAGDSLVLSVAWQVDVGSARVLEDPLPQTGGLAVSSDGSRLYAALADGNLVAFDARDGTRVWSTDIGGAPTGAPALVDGVLYVGAPDGTLRAVDASSGTERWRIATPGSFGSTPTVFGGVVYIVSSNSRMLAVDMATGRSLWSFDRPPARTIGMVGQSAVLVSDNAACAGFADGSLACVSASGGETMWVTDLSNGARRLMDVDATPLRVGDIVVSASFDGGLAGVTAHDGEVVWRHAVRGATSPVEVDGMVVSTAADGSVLWLNAGTGEVAASLELESRGLLPAVRHGNALLVGGAYGGLYFVSARAPWILNRFDPDSAISALPATYQNAVFVLTDGGYLYRLQTATR